MTVIGATIVTVSWRLTSALLTGDDFPTPCATLCAEGSKVEAKGRGKEPLQGSVRVQRRVRNG